MPAQPETLYLQKDDLLGAPKVNTTAAQEKRRHS